MVIKNNKDVAEIPVAESGASHVNKKVLIGPEDGSKSVIMRLFKVLADGSTPLHIHAHEHIVKIEKGKGVVVDRDGRENPVQAGQSLFIPGNEEHQFRNPHQEPFEFICIILNPDQGQS